MKKLRLLTATIAAAALFAATFIACNPDKPMSYTVTVTADPTGGKAGAGVGDKAKPTERITAAEGQTVTLSATAEEGYVFDGWTVTEGVALSPSAAASTVTFVMPAKDITAKAAFADHRMFTISFESAKLFDVTGDNKYTNIYWGIELAKDDPKMGKLFDGILYSEAGANFGGYYTTYNGKYETWGGFAISANNDRQTNGITNQFSAYASSITKFAVASDLGGWLNAAYERPTITFDKPVKPVSAMFANTTWVYLYCTGSDFKGYYTVAAAGFNGGKETGTASIELAKDGKIVGDWTEFDLSALGTVDTIKFTVASDDTMLPAYFCMDDLKVTHPDK